MRIVLLSFALFLFCFPSNAATTWGPSHVLGKGTTRTFVEKGRKGELVSAGIVLSEHALDGLPAADAELPLELPSGTDLFTGAVLNWNAHGHEPVQLYGVPHFDFHFYMISEMERMAIRCDAADAACMQKPDDSLIPPQYVPAPSGVPMMGWHWVDLTAPEMNGKPFSSTFIYGYYAGKPIFLEPMITREFLLSRTRLEAPIRRPAAAVRAGTYPSSYSVEFTGGEYRITLFWR